jgi:cytohesin
MSLIEAIKQNDVQHIKNLLNRQAVQPNHADTIEALHKAAFEGYLEIVELLVNFGVDVNCRDPKQRTALDRAMENLHLDVVDHLIQHGADVNGQDKYGQTQLHLAVDFEVEETLAYEHSLPPSSRVTRFLLTHGADGTIKDNRNRTPLDWARDRGHQKAVKLILRAQQPLKQAFMPLMETIKKGDSQGVKTLLARQIMPPDDPDAVKILNKAIFLGHLEIVKFLNEYNLDLNAQDEIDSHPLECAVEALNLELVSYLLDCGVEVNQRGYEGNTPLHWAIEAEVEEAYNNYVDRADQATQHIRAAPSDRVTALLVARGADPQRTNDQGETPLDWAVKYGHHAAVRLLEAVSGKQITSTVLPEAKTAPTDPGMKGRQRAKQHSVMESIAGELDLRPNTPFTLDTYKIFRSELASLTMRQQREIGMKRQFASYRLIQRAQIELPKVYRSKLPTYLLARCPICGGRVHEAVDTFSLSGPGWWLSESRGFGWYGRQIKMPVDGKMPPNHRNRLSEPSYQTECDHVQAVTYNVNLNNVFPDDVSPLGYVIIGSEPPQVLRPFMEQSGSYAVIHAMPVGRLDDETWQPWYTVYFSTYFHEKPYTLQQALGGDPADLVHFFWPHHKLDFNLQPWLEKGQLYWLDPATPDFSLAQPPKPFPYPDVPGLVGRWALRYHDIYLLPNVYQQRLKDWRDFPAQIRAQREKDLETQNLRHIQDIDQAQFQQTCFAWLPQGSRGSVVAEGKEMLYDKPKSG